MKVTHNLDPFPYILVDEYFSPTEVGDIWGEMLGLATSNAMLPATATGTAVDLGGNLLKNNRAVFLYEKYGDRAHESKIIAHSTNRLFGPEMREQYLSSPSWFFNRGFPVTNRDTVLVSYYESGDMYQPHHDCGLFTALTWFFKEPKAFRGGNFIFSHFGIEIEVLPNRCVIFPSLITHEVTPVTMNSDAEPMSGRFTLTHFATTVPANG